MAVSYRLIQDHVYQHVLTISKVADPMRLAILLAPLFALVASCGINVGVLQDPPNSTAVLTGGPWASMIYLARVEGGVIAIDLGFDGDGTGLVRGLAELGAQPEDVVAVFLTHSHRDHIAAWRTVSAARFYVAAAERPRLHGTDEHRGFVPRWVDRLVAPDLPDADSIDVAPFTGDTLVAFGADTVRLFHVPGHTPGSAAYVFRGVLFGGDALAWTPLRGFHSAKRIFSDDVARSRESMAALWKRTEPLGVKLACTAHGRCAAVDSAFIRAALR